MFLLFFVFFFYFTFYWFYFSVRLGRAVAQQQQNARFHTGTLSSWQLLLTLARSSRALQVAPAFYSSSRAPPFCLLPVSMPHLSSLATRGSRPKPLEDANSAASFFFFSFFRVALLQTKASLAFPLLSNSSVTAATDIHLLSSMSTFSSSSLLDAFLLPRK